MYSYCGVIITLRWTIWAAFDLMVENKINTTCCIDSIDKVISLLPEYVGYFCDHTQEQSSLSYTLHTLTHSLHTQKQYTAL